MLLRGLAKQNPEYKGVPRNLIKWHTEKIEVPHCDFLQVQISAHLLGIECSFMAFASRCILVLAETKNF